MSHFLSTLASLVLATSAFVSSGTVPLQVSVAKWEPQIGDQVLVDTKGNWGYIAHNNGLFLRFPVVTGQRRNVWYIGRHYNATTPTWDWEIQSLDIKGDRVTFGPTGRFLRLYRNGEERTAYGIHGHRDAKQMLEDAYRFRTMGCIVVSEEILDILERTFILNEERLPVTTVYGHPPTLLASQ